MESNVKFPVYSSYIFELLFKNKLFNYISRTNYYISQSIGSYYIYITSKCLFVFNKAIFTYISGWFLMNFAQKLAT